MQSLQLLRRRYDGYEAHPKPLSRQSTIDENKDGLSKEEGEKKDQEIQQKRRNNDPHYVTWDSDDDSMNPQNWSKKKKWGVLILVSTITLIVTFSSSVYSGVSKIVSEEFGISEELSELGTALYLCGFGVGPLFFGPMSEAFGRTPVYLATFLGFILCQLGPALGQNPQTIFILRFFSGFFGSSPLSNAGGSINDMFSPVERSLSFPIFAAMPFLGPVIGPLIAGACTVSGTSMLNATIDWRWAYWLTMIWGSAIFLLMILLLPETQGPAILHLKAKAVRRQTRDDAYYCDLDKRPESALKLILTAFPKPIILLFTEPIILALSTYLLVIYAILYMDFQGYSFLFANPYYRFNLVQVGLAFIPIGVGVVLCGLSAPLQQADYARFYDRAIAEGKPMASPEFRLRPLMIGGFFVPIGVFWLAWSARPGVHWAAPVLSGVPFGIGLLFVFLVVYQYLIDCYGDLAASALAAATLFRYLGAGGLVMVANPMYMNLAYVDGAGRMIYAWPLSLLGFLSILCLPIPFVLYFGGGAWLRQKSPRCVKF